MTEYNSLGEVLEELERKIDELDLEIARLKRRVKDYQRERRALLEQRDAMYNILKLGEKYGDKRQNP